MPNSDKSWSLTWDYENRLTGMERTKGAEKRTVTFKYDPFGRRIEKKLVTIIDGVTRTTTTTYVYDNEDIALEIVNDEATTARTRYIHGPGIDEPLALERNGQFYFYHHDGLGSVTAITDSSRNVVQRYSYESFGNPRQTIIFRNSYQYTSRERDFETGLHYHRERYYDPVEGRFITKDPIGFEGAVNVYNYTGNDPQNYPHPDGLDPRTPGGGPNETNPVTRCHVNPHNDGYENAIGGAIIGGALIRVAASGFVKLDPPQK